MIKTLYPIVSIIFFVGLYSCKSTKSISQGDQRKSNKELQHAIDHHNYDFEWFSAKGSIKYRTLDEVGKATINIRMKKDSIVWMQIKKYGLEISRALMTPDSVFVVYRWERFYEKGLLEEYTAAYNTNFNFSELQDFFFGNVTTSDHTEVISQDSSAYHLTAREEGIRYDYYINPYNLSLEKISIKDIGQREVLGKYGDYRTDENRNVFSYFREYTFKEDNEVTYISLDYSNIEIDVPKNIRFEIPAHYDRL